MAGATEPREPGRKERSPAADVPQGQKPNDCELCLRLCEKCVSAGSGASGAELIAKSKDGVSSKGIDAGVIG